MIFEIKVQGFSDWFDFRDFDELFNQLQKDVDTVYITDCNDNLNLDLQGEVEINYLKELASDIEYLEEDYEDEFYALLDYFNDFDEAYDCFTSHNYTFMPEVYDEYDLGQELVDTGYFGDVEESLKDFIDFNKLGIATTIDKSYMFTEYGYIEIY